MRRIERKIVKLERRNFDYFYDGLLKVYAYLEQTLAPVGYVEGYENCSFVHLILTNNSKIKDSDKRILRSFKDKFIYKKNSNINYLSTVEIKNGVEHLHLMIAIYSASGITDFDVQDLFRDWIRHLQKRLLILSIGNRQDFLFARKENSNEMEIKTINSESTQDAKEGVFLWLAYLAKTAQKELQTLGRRQLLTCTTRPQQWRDLGSYSHLVEP